MTALTTYLTNTNDGLVATARQLASSAPASETSVTLTGMPRTGSTGWAEIPSQGGNLGSWLGAEPAASGKGFLWDVTTLEGQQMAAGNWTPTIKLSCTAAFTVDLICRAFVRSSGGVYTQIGSDMKLAGQVLSSTATVYTFGATALGAQNFSTGDKLYLDFLLDSTVDLGLIGNATLTFYENGGANEQVVTPGYGGPPPVLDDAEGLWCRSQWEW